MTEVQMQIFYYSFYVSSIILIVYYIHILLEKNISNNLKIIRKRLFIFSIIASIIGQLLCVFGIIFHVLLTLCLINCILIQAQIEKKIYN